MKTDKMIYKDHNDIPYSWNELMLNNNYYVWLFLGVGSLTVQLIFIRDYIDMFISEDGLGKWFVGIFGLIPMAIIFFVAYLGMYKHWKAYKATLKKSDTQHQSFNN